MERRKKRNIGVFLLIVGLLLLVFALTRFTIDKIPLPDSGAETAQGKLGDNFTLTGHLGNKVSLRDFKGRVVLIFFGYTFCPVICPTGLNEINIVLKELGDLAGKVQVFFITVDPQRDTHERLKEFMSNFNNMFLGLTGSVEEVRKVTDLYEAAFVKRLPDENGDYTVSHSTTTYVVDHEGVYVDMLPLNTPKDDFQRILRKHIENAIDAGKL